MAFRRVLVVDDEESMRHALTLLLGDAGYDARAVGSAQAALSELERSPPDVVLTDVRMPGMTGLELLREIQARSPDTTVIVMSAYGSVETALEAMKAGAYDYISKPFRQDEVVLVLRKAEERERLVRENRRLRQAQPEQGLSGLVGRSAPFAAMLRLVRKVAEVKTTTLVLGESGTGKELVARALHELSPRREGPFIAVNCGAISEHLIESELFGHVKGAFTDAHQNRKGLFEEADGGTLFLDEVGELPLSMQVKLLRVLQEEEIRRVGDSRSLRVDVRVVAATVRDLPEEVKQGRFREDLYYRLNVVQVAMPPLRDRPDDVPALVEHFVAEFNTRLGGARIEGFTPEAMEVLEHYAWPGNVRELENVVERAMVLAESEWMDLETLPEKLLEAPATARLDPATGGEDLSIKRATRALEAQLIARALEQTGGNRTRAAHVLDLSHRALLYKLKEYGIK